MKFCSPPRRSYPCGQPDKLGDARWTVSLDGRYRGYRRGVASTEVEFYWRPGCPFCMMLQADLERSGLPVRAVNIWEDPEAAARVRSVADGNETVPTVFVGERVMVNPSIAEVEAAVREHGGE
jgi:mycoredoxin